MPETVSTLTILGVVIAGLLLGSLNSFLQAILFIRTAHKVQGKVIRLAEKSVKGGGYDFFPVFLFTTSTGEEVTVTQTTNIPRLKTGAVVEVLYQPQNPKNAKVNSWVNFYLFPTLMVVFAIGLGATAFFVT